MKRILLYGFSFCWLCVGLSPVVGDMTIRVINQSSSPTTGGFIVKRASNFTIFNHSTTGGQLSGGETRDYVLTSAVEPDPESRIFFIGYYEGVAFVQNQSQPGVDGGTIVFYVNEGGLVSQKILRVNLANVTDYPETYEVTNCNTGEVLGSYIVAPHAQVVAQIGPVQDPFPVCFRLRGSDAIAPYDVDDWSTTGSPEGNEGVSGAGPWAGSEGAIPWADTSDLAKEATLRKGFEVMREVTVTGFRSLGNVVGGVREAVNVTNSKMSEALIKLAGIQAVNQNVYNAATAISAELLEQGVTLDQIRNYAASVDSGIQINTARIVESNQILTQIANSDDLIRGAVEALVAKDTATYPGQLEIKSQLVTTGQGIEDEVSANRDQSTAEHVQRLNKLVEIRGDTSAMAVKLDGIATDISEINGKLGQYPTTPSIAVHDDANAPYGAIRAGVNAEQVAQAGNFHDPQEISTANGIETLLRFNVPDFLNGGVYVVSFWPQDYPVLWEILIWVRTVAVFAANVWLAWAVIKHSDFLLQELYKVGQVISAGTSFLGTNLNLIGAKVTAGIITVAIGVFASWAYSYALETGVSNILQTYVFSNIGGVCGIALTWFMAIIPLDWIFGTFSAYLGYRFVARSAWTLAASAIKWSTV